MSHLAALHALPLLLLLLLQAVQLFGDQCQLWATFNEPTVSQQCAAELTLRHTSGLVQYCATMSFGFRLGWLDAGPGHSRSL
jgi:hypothetical protein